MKNAYTHYEQTVIDNITLEAYDIESKGSHEDVQQVHSIFLDERGFIIKQIGEVPSFIEWIQGLPSVFTVPFYNYQILENAKKAGYKLDTEAKEDDFLDRYFANVAKAFFTLKNNL